MLEERINQDIKQAMLAHKKDELESLRAIKAALLLLKTGTGTVDDAAEVATLKKLVKQRHESADIYVRQGRQDLADDELRQAAVIERYLPQMLSREEVEKTVREVIAELGATGPKDMGRVMGTCSKKFNGQADNKMVSEIVKSILNS